MRTCCPECGKYLNLAVTVSAAAEQRGDRALAEKWYAINRRLRSIAHEGPTAEWRRLIDESKSARREFELSKLA